MDGLRVVELAPPGPLRGRVRLMAGFTERGAPLRRREVPIAGLVVVLSLGPDLWVDGEWTGSFAAGLYDRPVVTGHGGEQAGLQLYVPPLAGRALLGVPPAELFNRTVALSRRPAGRARADRARGARAGLAPPRGAGRRGAGARRRPRGARGPPRPRPARGHGRRRPGRAASRRRRAGAVAT